MTSSTTDLLAGLIAGPHGLDGSFHVARPVPSLLTVGSRVLLDGLETEILRRAGTDARPILRVTGCEDRDAARALRGAELRVMRATAPQLGLDEWWAEDLEGCAVEAEGVAVGTVSRLLSLPSCDVLEVRRTGDVDPLLVPLVRDAVASVDPERKVIEVDLHFLGED